MRARPPLAISTREASGGARAMTYDPEQYLQAHRQTWHGFLRLATWSTAAVVLALILMALFLL